jgi:alpha-glucosidase
LAEVFDTPPDTRRRYLALGTAKLVDHDNRGMRLRVGSATVEVATLAPDLFRVGMFPESQPPRYGSEAMAKENWEPVAAKMSGEEVLTLSTEAAIAHLSLDPLRISFADYSGRTFAADDEELGMGVVERPEADAFAMALGKPVRLYKRREDGERYFGCGERTSGLEKTGSNQIFWNVDPPAGHTASFNIWSRITSGQCV